MREFNYVSEKKSVKIDGKIYELKPSSVAIAEICQKISDFSNVSDASDILTLANVEYELVSHAIGKESCIEVLGDLMNCDVYKLGGLSGFLLEEYNKNESAD